MNSVINPGPSGNVTRADLAIVLLIVSGSAVLRLLFFNGPLGSDDIVYTNRALQIASGEWSSANYNGALRYGFNIPAGFFVWLLGPSVASVNLWPLLCSLFELVVVYLLALLIAGRRTAVIAGLLLATLPLHVAAATRIHVDPVAAFAMTLSFALFYTALCRGAVAWFLLAGMAMGFVFWCRELVIFYAVLFFLLATALRIPLRHTACFAAGGLVMLLLHMMLMWWIAGDPLHFFNIVLGQVDTQFVHGSKEHEAGYYFRYFFLKPVHNFLLGPLVVMTCLAMLARAHFRRKLWFPLFWAIGLIALFSFLPISLQPFKLITKQANYLVMFFAPLAILAAFLLARIPGQIGIAAVALVIAGNIGLAAMEQQTIRVFTANGHAVSDWAESKGEVATYGSVNNANISRFRHRIGIAAKGSTQVLELADLDARSKRDPLSLSTAVVFVDPETLGWSPSDPRIDASSPPPCWQTLDTLEPINFGATHALMAPFMESTGLKRLLPGSIYRALSAYYEPGRGTLFTVPMNDPWCRGTAS